MSLNKLPDVIICHFCQLIVAAVNPVNDELFHLFQACKQPLQYRHKVCDTCIRRRKRKLDKEKLNDHSENTMSSVMCTMSFSSGSECSQQSEQAMLPPPLKKRPGPLSTKRPGPLSAKRPGPLSSKQMSPMSSHALDDSWDKIVARTPEHRKTKTNSQIRNELVSNTDSSVNSSSQQLIANRRAPRNVLHERTDSQIRQGVLSQSSEQISDPETNLRNNDSSSSSNRSLNVSTNSYGTTTQESAQNLSDPTPAPRESTKNKGGQPIITPESSQNLSDPAPAPRERITNKGGQPIFSDEIVYVNNPENSINQQLSSASSGNNSTDASSSSNKSNTPAPALRTGTKNTGGVPSFSEEMIYENVNDSSNPVNQQLPMRTRSRSNSINSSGSISTAAPYRVSRVRESPPTRKRPNQPANVYRRNLGG